MFHDGDLQSGIALAVQSHRAVLCFVYDETATAVDWETALSGRQILPAVESQTVALKLKAGSQEATFLGGICPINSVPAIIVIRNATVELNLQAQQISLKALKDRLIALFGPEPVSHAASPLQSSASDVLSSEPADTVPDHQATGSPSGTTSSHPGYLDLQPSSGRFRLPNNAYDALRTHTQSLLESNEPPEQILSSQLTLLNRLPIFRDEVKTIRSRDPTDRAILSDAARDRLLRLPASAIKAQTKATPSQSSSSDTAAGLPVYTNQPNDTSAQSSNAPTEQAPAPSTSLEEMSAPPTYAASQQDIQRSDYVRLQKQREQSQRNERERIKAQIKADREERRRKEQVSKPSEVAAANEIGQTSSSRSKSSEIRIQVRTFDGSTLRTTFSPTSNITAHVRPWIDESMESAAPYNLKLILTPLPNRNIEASEEELALAYLGIIGSCTFVMVPVKGYVESYTGNTPTGLVGSAVSSGYNLVTGTVGAVFSAVKGVYRGLGPQKEQPPVQEAESSTSQHANQRNMRVRTLADQRREERGRDQQFYNGNALNFAPNKDDDESRKDD